MIASSRTIRDVNRHLILGLIRAQQPVSRADLARRTGLQRSTVSQITDDLIRQRWVTEGATGHSARGRKPRLLYLNVERARILGVDVRPAATTIAVADPNGRVVAYEKFSTARRPGVFVRDVSARVQALLQANPGHRCEGIGVTVPGTVDETRRRLVSAPNLGWHDIDLKTPIERATGIPVELENAANACAIAEASFGAHRDIRDLIVVTVSEGIGTGIICNGQLVRGASGLAREFGHVSLDDRGPGCSCGRRGCWEVYASNVAAIRAYSEAHTPRRRRASAGESAPATITFDQLLVLAGQRTAAPRRRWRGWAIISDAASPCSPRACLPR